MAFEAPSMASGLSCWFWGKSELSTAYRGVRFWDRYAL